MYWLAPILVFVVLIFYESYKNKTLWKSFLFLGLALLITGITVAIDYSIKTTDTEVWSGRVVDWRHEEEYDELVRTCTTDSNGKESCSYHTEHHDAENYIKTSDGGWIYVKESPDGKRFTDRWPNDAEVLKQYWPAGTPTASVHTYTNKVQASYSIYKHKEIDLKDYPGLPKYPSKVRDFIYIDRIIGDVPNKEAALKALAEENAELNKFVPDPERPGKKKSWKQVNMIFVNLGVDKPQDWGFALQDYWEGGNKNDFVVSFSTDAEGKILWAYAFSWSEVEILKLEVQDYMMSLGKLTDFVPVVQKVSDMVAEKFERKQFADFSYLSIDTSTAAQIIIWILNVSILILGINVVNSEGSPPAGTSFRFSKMKRNRFPWR